MKAAETRILLWLDDTRNPFLDEEGKVPSFFDSIHWVVNYDQFTAWINKFGLPGAISFDHDLAEEHYTPAYFWNDYEESKKFQEWRSQFYQHKTGEDCAKWLVEYCNSRGERLPITFVHSANPVGADKILEALKTCDVVGRSDQLPPNPITDKEYKKLIKSLYPKDNSKRFRRS